jgi:probable rRNA maturation factor
VNAVHRIEVRFAARKPWAPSSRKLAEWARVALASGLPSARRRVPLVVSVQVVGTRRSRALNARYRGKEAPTNVLSFAGAGQLPSGERDLGELIICAPVLAREARAQRKSPAAHWAHITIHGVLHLLGRDHQTAREARNMETLETQILETMGFSNPYG